MEKGRTACVRPTMVVRESLSSKHLKQKVIGVNSLRKISHEVSGKDLLATACNSSLRYPRKGIVVLSKLDLTFARNWVYSAKIKRQGEKRLTCKPFILNQTWNEKPRKSHLSTKDQEIKVVVTHHPAQTITHALCQP